MQRDQPVEVLRFVNDYRKALARLKVKSFYAFHTCQLRCLRSLDSERSRECMADCERDLDDFHRWRKETKPQEAARVYYGPRIFAEDAPTQQEYEKVCRRANLQLLDYIASLDYRLDGLLRQYAAK